MYDHRFQFGKKLNTDSIQKCKPVRLLLRHTERSLINDVSHFGYKRAAIENTLWDEDACLTLHARVLPLIQKPLCLDPTLDVLRLETIKSHKCSAYVLPAQRKRKFDDDTSAVILSDESKRLQLLMGKQSEFCPRFSQQSFVEEWRKKKQMADAEPLIGLNDKSKIKHPNMLQFNVNRRVVRTLKFEQATSTRTLYTTLNVYDVNNSSNEYEAVMRWGESEGTSLGKEHNTIRFPLGNKMAVEYYVGHLKGFYGINHKLVSENHSADQTHLNPSSTVSIHYQPPSTPNTPKVASPAVSTSYA